MTLDKETRLAIAAAVAKATMEANEVYNEEYLTAEQLCKQIPMFKLDWVRRNWKRIPSERMTWEDANGIFHDGEKVFPKKKILREIAEGKYRRMAYKAKA